MRVSLWFLGLLFLLSCEEPAGKPSESVGEPEKRGAPQKGPPAQRSVPEKEGEDPLSTLRSKNLKTIPDLIESAYQGSEFTVGRKLGDHSGFSAYAITYQSGDLTISGVMTQPSGEGPFPVIIANHGFYETNEYKTGDGLKPERVHLSKQGYVVVHPDYRNYAFSEKDPRVGMSLFFGYVEDVINLVLALKESNLPFIQKDNMGMIGHSMGGSISLHAVTIKPDLVKALVLYAPARMDESTVPMLMRVRPEAVSDLIEILGMPDAAPDLWRPIFVTNFLDRVKVPIQIHHGKQDTVIPFPLSEKTHQALTDLDKTSELFLYPNEKHVFDGSDWETFIERVIVFFGEHLAN